MRKTIFCMLTACLLLSTAAPAFARGVFADGFDWMKANQTAKAAMVNDLQNILIKEGILQSPLPANKLVAIVEAELKKDSEQALIIEKMCLGLRLNCDKLGKYFR